MQFRLIAALVVFAGSYLPLSMILLAQDYDYSPSPRSLCWNLLSDGCDLPLRNPAYSMGIFVFCFACLIATLVALRAVRAKISIKLTEAKYIPAELMNYTLPYVVSFMSLDYHETGHFVGLLIFLGWMFWITFKSGLLILNPVLIAFGWKHYDISYTFPGNGKVHTGVALANGPIAAEEQVEHAAVQNVLIIRVKRKAEESDSARD